ncbi:MAG: PqqD family peptide modification chaperone [Candidatus Competibacteraceae bacterium]
MPLCPLETYTVPLGDGGVLYRPAIDRLVVLNATGKLVWELLGEGYTPDEIAAVFAQHFGLSGEHAWSDVRAVLSHLEEAGFPVQPAGEIGSPRRSSLRSPVLLDAPAAPVRVIDCGTFRFGAHRVRVHSTVADIDAAYFSRFRHRAVAVANAGGLELLEDRAGYRLTFRGEIVAEVDSLAELLGRFQELLLSWEYLNTDWLAYFHAAAVRRDDYSVLLPGGSGVGKSTLTAYLVAQGFGYLGDDLIALDAADGALWPLPTCLSVKAGAWPILEPLYPTLPRLPTVHCHGRVIRYIEPDSADSDGHPAPAPAAIVFPHYIQGEPTRLQPVPPLLTMTYLIESNVALRQPVTIAKLTKLIQFVEQTPAYELTYFDLPGAMAAIKDLLENAV